MPATKELKPEELETGMRVTVKNGIGRCANDRSYAGDLLTVKCVDLPFVVVDRRSRWGVNRQSIDTREFEFKMCSAEYVTAMQEEPDGA